MASSAHGRGLLAFGLALASAAGGAGCGDRGDGAGVAPPPPGRRSEIVAAPSGARSTTIAPATSARTAPPRALCETPPAADGKPLPDGPLVKLDVAPPALPDRLPTGEGLWTWVNLWAGWCGPCKEEMPMLAAWHKELLAAGTPVRFTFVSLDDDEREARRFLSSQPAVQQSYRLPEGEGRRAWLSALGLPEAPELPMHLLFDAEGKLRCVVRGAVHEADLPRVKQVVSKR